MKSVLFYAVILLAGVSQNSSPSLTGAGEAILNALHPPPKPGNPPTAMKLPPGYRHASSVDFEGNTSGEITKAGALTIKYWFAPFGTLFSTEFPIDRNQYREYVEETINGRLLWRGFKSGRYEVNLDQCGTSEYSFVVRFSAAVKDSFQAADMITVAKSLARTSERPQGGIYCPWAFPTALPGYSQNLSIDSEANFVGKMTKKGLSIEYTMPPYPYPRRVPIDKSLYHEYAEETINGHHLWYGFHDGQFEANVDLCRVPEFSYIVHFMADAKESSGAAEMLTIARSLVEANRPRIQGCISMD